MITGFPQAKEDRVISFTDKNIESACSIRIFLSLCTAETWRGFLHPDWLSQVARAVQFLRKYDCPMPTRVICLMMRDTVKHAQVDPEKAFCIAAILDDIQLATSVVKAGGKLFAGFNYALGVEEILPFNTFVAIPTDYLYGLVYSWMLTTKGHDSLTISVKFRARMESLRKEK